MAGLSTRPLVRARPYDDSDGFIVDSSAVMDGQLLPLSRSGLFRDDLLVPRFVLDELQGMADANDERSRRAQRGLEILELLRTRGAVARARRRRRGARGRRGRRQARRARAQAPAPAADERRQPGQGRRDAGRARDHPAPPRGGPDPRCPRGRDASSVSLTRPGRHPGQGVGFLDDGSMVVVNGGEDLVGAGPVSLVVSSIVPTSAGRMVFARPSDPAASEPSPSPDAETKPRHRSPGQY